MEEKKENLSEEDYQREKKEIGGRKTVKYLQSLPVQLVVGYNGSAIYDIWCSAANFPNWQFSLPGNQLPMCQ